MSEDSIEHLLYWVDQMALLLDNDENPSSLDYVYFVQDPGLALKLVVLICDLDEIGKDYSESYYSSCLFAIDICVAQLQAASESSNKLATKTLNQFMAAIATAINSNKHSLNFWLPVLNAFYESHVELSMELKNAYLNLAYTEDEPEDDDDSHLNSIRDLIIELSDLSVFDIAENFFAQSYAMPADFFSDLVMDLYSIDEGHEIALLILMHPQAEVREVAVAAHEQLMSSISLSPIALSRLQTIKNFYPRSYHGQFNNWIKQQRKKGAVYQIDNSAMNLKFSNVKIKASEIDGGGAQGIFIYMRKLSKNRLCGLLFKQNVGIKEAWISPMISADEMGNYYNETLNDGVMLRSVDLSYLVMMINHFLAISLEHGTMPDLHLLAIQEELGISLYPKKLDIDYLMSNLAVQINPFTPDCMRDSFKRSKLWPKNKSFMESWYEENSKIDKIVNYCSSFVDGVRMCHFDEAVSALLCEEMELNRERWMFHFLWFALWFKSKSRPTDRTWKDGFFIAYAIYTGLALNKIPILYEICYQSVLNSINTMQERRTHLN